MKKLKKFQPQRRPSWVTVLVIAVAVFAVAQLVKAAPGGLPGQPGVKYDTVQASDDATGATASYSDMPGMYVPFVTSASSPATVTVSVATPNSSRALSGCGYFMRLVVDGNPQPEEVPAFFATWDSRSFTLVTPMLAAGSHTVGAQWKEVSYLGSACVQVRSMVVSHQ